MVWRICADDGGQTQAVCANDSTSTSSTEEEFAPVEFLGAPHPVNEEERQQALCGLEVLDTPTKADERFDDITKLVSFSWLTFQATQGNDDS